MKEQLLITLENSRNYTMGVAAAMPDNMYDAKPVQTVWGFGELLHHIGYGIHWWERNYIQKVKTDWDPPIVPGSKAEVMEYLLEAYDGLQQTISTTELTATAVQGFHATIDHITHHRGQAVLYLRYKDIAPPEYVY
jgi:hypothetical protein